MDTDKQARNARLMDIMRRHQFTAKEVAARVQSSESIAYQWLGPACDPIIPAAKLKMLEQSITLNPPEPKPDVRPGRPRLYNNPSPKKETIK